MDQVLVLTLIGADRPGLVETLSRVIAEHGGSWQESSMARLAGHFAGILQLSVPEARSAELTRSLAELAELGLKVTIEDGAAEAEVTPAAALQLELVGQDRPGIVREISSAIAGLGVNVLSLESRCSPAPMSGETLFTARASLEAPAGLNLDALQASLERIADDLMADLRFGPPTDGAG